MCQAALESKNLKKSAPRYRSIAEKCIKDITSHQHARIVNSGNSAILAAMSTLKGPVLIPDQGGWTGFKKIAEFLGLRTITMPTDMGLVDPQILEETITSKKPEAFFITSFAGYTAEQPIKEIFKVCDEEDVLLVEDASGAVGDPEGHLANGENSHIIIGSTGSPKIVNVGSGGFISTNSPEIFLNNRFLIKSLQTSHIICAGIVEEIKNAPENLSKTTDATLFLKKSLDKSLHPDKRGVNVSIPIENAKIIARTLRNGISVVGGGIISTCPRYDRFKKPGVCLEVKNLDISCLDTNNLQEIAKIVNDALVL